MSCTTLSNIRKSCDITIGGIKEVYVRDYDSFDGLDLISGFSLYTGTNTYPPGFYGPYQVYSNVKGAYIPMTVNIQVIDNDSAESSDIRTYIVDNTYYDPLWENNDTFSFPDFESNVILDNGEPLQLAIESTSKTSVKFGIVDNKIQFSKGRTENDFGETISPNWYQIQITKQGSSFMSVRAEDLSTGNSNYTNTLKMVLNRVSNPSDVNKLIQGERYLSVKFIDTDNNTWAFGLYTPAICVKIDKKTGMKASDANNIEITIESKEVTPEYFVDNI